MNSKRDVSLVGSEYVRDAISGGSKVVFEPGTPSNEWQHARASF